MKPKALNSEIFFSDGDSHRLRPERRVGIFPFIPPKICEATAGKEKCPQALWAINAAEGSYLIVGALAPFMPSAKPAEAGKPTNLFVFCHDTALFCPASLVPFRRRARHVATASYAEPYYLICVHGGDREA
jgi:hypothetical protein